ncbi:hypothetical protein [Rhodovulum euryhalinum]|uniref:Uncharacterized protein n=1 Tax=Rhodovulum euryhalinum TaxID=35805 RepID=A0A4R2K8S3_9RHOB|nr:hypothetical protein [Rhodovulum euryhalinum]TCO68502.1 hypothetical protein EV655_1279 [Rhodovulum euryhalinum]
MQAAWRTAERTILALTDPTGHVIIVEPGHPLWPANAHRDDIAAFVPETPPAPTPEELRAAMPPLTRRQVFIALHRLGLLSAAEAVAAAATGVVPAALEPHFAGLPDPAQTEARVTFAAFREAFRLDPLTRMIAEAGGLDEAALDAIWTGFATV